MNTEQAIAQLESCGKKFSDEQLAILRTSGGIDLLAVAGSGKTFTMTNLIAKRLLTGEIQDASRVLCTTFSKAGVEEFEERLNKLLSENRLPSVKVTTLHAACYEILRQFGIRVNNVLGEGEALRLLREACKGYGYGRISQDDLTQLLNTISLQYNSLMSDSELIKSSKWVLDMEPAVYVNIRKKFEELKQNIGAIDFDDMQRYVYEWLCVQKYENVLQWVRSRYTLLYIDEFQDTNPVQLAIITAILGEYRPSERLVVVGDDDQCLPEGTMVLTENGYKAIETLMPHQRVITACGHGKVKSTPISYIGSREVDEDIVVIKTKLGKKIRGTRNHVGFCRIVPRENEYYTYLMYRHDVGFRVGTTSGVRTGARGLENGIKVRLMQERSDRIWILKVVDSDEKARYWEAYYAYKYSIPMYRFVTSDSGAGLPKTALSTEDVYKLHRELGTTSAGMRLLSDMGMMFEFPHHVPQAEGDRKRLNYTMFSSGDMSSNGCYKSELYVNTNDSGYVEILEKHLSVTDRKSKTKYEYKNARLTTNKLWMIEEKAKAIEEECKLAGIYLEREDRAKLTEETYKQMNFGNFRVGMCIPTYVDGAIVDDEVISVEYERYTGKVYDLQVDETRNFIAEDVCTHNCIYEWRGTDPRILINICGHFDLSKRYLTTNYRCPEVVVEKAGNCVVNMGEREQKIMRSNKSGGSVKLIDIDSIGNDSSENNIRWNNPICKGSEAIAKMICDQVSGKEGICLDKAICVLSRNNATMRILANMLYSMGVAVKGQRSMYISSAREWSTFKRILKILTKQEMITDVSDIMWQLIPSASINFGNMISSVIVEAGCSIDWALERILDACYSDRVFLYASSRKLITGDTNKKGSGIVNAKTIASIEYEIGSKGISADSLVEIINALRVNNETDGAIRLLSRCKIASEFVYKTKGQKRGFESLIEYFMVLVSKYGYAGVQQFITATEQFENGNYAVDKRVELRTIHGAKGGEWDTVYILMDDNIEFPNLESIAIMRERGVDVTSIMQYIDSERRLHYVAQTRASRRLFIVSEKKNASVFVLESCKCGGTNEDILKRAVENRVRNNEEEIKGLEALD